MAKGDFSIADLQKELHDINPFGGNINKNEFSATTEWIRTGNYHMNAAFTGSLFGGIPNNRSVQLAGPSGTGKTYFMLNIAREAQRQGYYVIYYDTEGAIDLKLVESFGIDPDQFNHQPVSDLFALRTSMTKLLKSMMDIKKKGKDIPKIFIALDSLGMMATEKEIADAISGNTAADMTRSKTIRSLFRIITSDLAILKIPFVFSNHTYESQGYISQTQIGGGEGSVYSSSIIATLTKAQLKENDKLSGIIVTVKIKKNRFAKPEAIKLWLRYDSPMNQFVGLEEYLSWDVCGIDRGLILTQKDFKKLSPDDAKLAREFATPDGELQYFYPKATAQKYIVKHLGRAISIKELYTDLVFTTDVLLQIDEKCVKPKFSYGMHDVELESFVEDEINVVNEQE